MAFEVTSNEQSVIAKLESRLGDPARGRLTAEVQSLAFDVQARVKRALSGEVLNVQTGNLRSHIFEDVVSTREQVIGQVFASGVKYAAPNEFGGRGFYEIVARNGKALHWLSGGQDVFRRMVNHPPAKERSYMRFSLREMRDQIISRIRGAVLGHS